MRRIRFLESRLCRYEDVIPFDPNSKMADDEECFDYEATNDEFNEMSTEKKNIFIDDDDESHQRVVCQIGEGATSITYKVVDERTDEEMCKKVLKAEEGKTTFKDVQNIYKEFEVLQRMSHPSICKCIGMNMQEKINNNSADQFDEGEIKIKNHRKSTTSKTGAQKTTIAIFLKYHPMNLRECLEDNILNNTLKAKLSVEVAFWHASHPRERNDSQRFEARKRHGELHLRGTAD